MPDSEHPSLRQQFSRVIGAPPDDRAAALDRECGGDKALRRRLEAMVAGAEAQGGFLAEPAQGRTTWTPTQSTPHEGAGSSIGPYKLLEQIGQGGFGVVFKAEQRSPITRTVALKIIKLGMDTLQVIARFEAERQALAMMDHPNIARVLDAGATETGRPYFVMELVRGDPITEYCDRNNLSTRDRLDLFTLVCNAVQHAHQKGIIHRDIKPSNVLVTVADGRPIPKVIDFGIAKATNQRLTEKTLFTEHRALIGTPAYMSPEQAEMTGVDIDTRSDIYSLGVLLYELLTGTTPFDTKSLMEVGYAEIQRIIREVEPPKPSTRISTMRDTLPAVAAHRQIEPGRLSALVRGDLDWIVMRALEKDRTRRYDTASALAADVGRHLASEPVTAVPPSAAYQARKFVRRHRVGVFAGAVVAGALVLGAAGTTWGLVRAARESHRARQSAVDAGRESAKAVAVNAFLQQMLGAADPSKAGRRDVPIDFVLQQAGAKLQAGSLRDQPAVEASVRTTLGTTYAALGLYSDAEPHLRRAVELSREVYGDQHEQYAQSLHTLGVFLCRLKWELPEPESLLREAVAIRKKLFGDTDLRVGQSLYQLAINLHCAGEHDEPIQIEREIAAILAKNGVPALPPSELAPGVPLVISFVNEIVGGARRLQGEGDFDGAVALCRQSIADRIRDFGHDHPNVAEAFHFLAEVLRDRGDDAGAELAAREAYQIKRTVYGENHVLVLAMWANYIAVLVDQNKIDAARAELREAILMGYRLLPGKNPAPDSLVPLAQAVDEPSLAADAEPFFREALAFHRRVNGEKHYLVSRCLCNLARIMRHKGDHEAAVPLLREAVEIWEQLFGADHWETVEALVALGEALEKSGRQDEAIEVIRSCCGRSASLSAGWSWKLVNYQLMLSEMLTKRGRTAEAERLIRDLAAQSRSRRPESDPYRSLAIRELGKFLAAQGRPAEAEPLLREHLALEEATRPKTWHKFAAMTLLGGVLADQGRFAEAEPLLLAGHEGLKSGPQVRHIAYFGCPGRAAAAASDRIERMYTQRNAIDPGKATGEKAKK